VAGDCDQAVEVFQLLQHFHAAGAAVDHFDFRRQDIVTLQRLDHPDPDALIGQQDVADSQYDGFSH
jgi:hypothetical protein